jgi:hypothetical protein
MRPLPGINGRLEPYQEWTERLFRLLALISEPPSWRRKRLRTAQTLSKRNQG